MKTWPLSSHREALMKDSIESQVSASAAPIFDSARGDVCLARHHEHKPRMIDIKQDEW